MARSYTAKQKRVKVKIEGAEKIVKALNNMDTGAEKILAKAAKAGGDIAVNEAKRKCPVDTGALKNSIKMQLNKVTEKRAVVKIDYDKKLKYGVFVELGAKGRAPNPFMRNAVDKNKGSINNAIVSEVKKAIKNRF